MQKTRILSLVHEEIIRGIVFATTLMILFTAFFWSIAYTANPGGLFGEILNRILASGNWQTDTTGTVKNAEKLWNELPTVYMRATAIDCGTNKCIRGIDASGNPQCN
jgi:hypothetical protein